MTKEGNMWKNIKIVNSADQNVLKYVFEKEDAVAESVLYKYPTYENRTVICCSTQSGCPVGCRFCGAGDYFVRSLTPDEIVSQPVRLLEDTKVDPKDIKRLQIMFMSMGEPMLNWDNVYTAISRLNGYYPNAQLLVSTVGVNHKALCQLINLGKIIDKVGLQFSIHEAWEEKRNELIPYKNKLTLRQIRDVGTEWYKETGRQVYLNYCVTPDNISYEEQARLLDLFPPRIFAFTFSVVCEANETMKDAHRKNIHLVNYTSETFLKAGYNTRVFDPAGQDDIGGGCGQLWYVQDWMKNRENK